MIAPKLAPKRLLRAQEGFTMLIVLGVLTVTSILLIAALTTAIGDSHLSREDTNQKQAYYAALAGIQEYVDELQRNPDYWESCETPSGSVPGETSNQSYKIELLVASTSEGAKECSPTNPFKTVIESKGTLTNTFRVKSTGSVVTTGYAGSATRSLVATFQVSGFLNYLYYTNYEQGDPGLFGSNKECERKYYSEWSMELKIACTTIAFATGDSVNGPMHTNDSAKVIGAASFGRSGQKPPDPAEINGGVYTSVGSTPLSNCTGLTAVFNTASGCYSKGATLVAPETDTSLALYVEPQNEYTGTTHLELLGAKNEIAVTYYEENEKGELVKKEKTVEWPKNGLIYVKGSSTHACAYEYKFWNSDNKTEEENEKACGNVYIKGAYARSLTVAGENDVIINGSVTPAGLALGSEPTGTPVVGLIASHYVRIWHPITGTNSQTGCGSSKNSESWEPWIYAALLATSHSFVVDNYNCGVEEGKLNVYGAIAQNYRGPVGTTSAAPTGYTKNYKYDGRLAVDEPPYFLSPFKSGWKVIRETAPTPG